MRRTGRSVRVRKPWKLIVVPHGIGRDRLRPESRACPSPNVARRLLRDGARVRNARVSQVTAGAGKQPRRGGTNSCRRLPFGSPIRANVQHISGATVLPGERISTKAASDKSDCLRAVTQSNNLSFRISISTCTICARSRLERGTYCLGDNFKVSPGGARRGLTCRSAQVRMAGCGLASPCACGRWLPVWLPEILLATLTFGCPGHDAGAGSSPGRHAMPS